MKEDDSVFIDDQTKEDIERDAWMNFSKKQFEKLYDADEVDYNDALLKESNPKYNKDE